MTPQEFIAKWKKAQLSERSAAQQHFLDLCELLGQPKPVAADPEGAWYTFERGAHKTGGGEGWADVWMRKHFAWEYKRKRRSLTEAYQQLLRYREDLENPPLLVVSCTSTAACSRPPGWCPCCGRRSPSSFAPTSATGATSSPRSSARCSSARATRPSANGRC